MRSPFPGMDPYLEAHWPDVHLCLLGLIRDELHEKLPQELVARIGMELTELDDPQEPVQTLDPIKQRWLCIQECSGPPITVIEVLSPWNRWSDEAARWYVQRRTRWLDSGANLVEIDLIRTGRRSQQTRYEIRTREAGHQEPAIQSFGLFDPLPMIRIPLRPGEDSIEVDLQRFVQLVYLKGRYDGLDYDRPCQPPLDVTEAAQVDKLLRSRVRC